MKTVTYEEFTNAKRNANEELRRMSNALFNEPDRSSNVELFEAGTWGKKDKSIRMEVNWCACGSVEPSKALAMAQLLQKAAELASTFVYNGYTIED